jgi:hypothetical protein
VCADENEDVLGAILGVFDANIEVAVFGENAGVHQFILGIFGAAAPVFGDEIVIGEGCLRVFVQGFGIGIGGGGVQVEIGFFDVLAVVAFRSAQAEEPLFENGIAAVPQHGSKAEPALAVTEAE